MVPDTISLDEKLRIAIEIGKALDVTHRRGIVHGDVKPENTMIRPDGLVKVLDFGLSRLMQVESAVAEAHREPRQGGGGAEATHKGGTPRYMSPEQVRGEAGDARSDIFSLGVLTYELCVQKPPFSGETIRDLFDAILHHEPKPLALHLKTAPKSLCQTLDKALKKNPDERYQTASELLVDLEKARAELAQPPWLKKHAKLLLAAALIASILAIVLWKISRPGPDDHPREIRTLDKARIGEGLAISRPSFSPDGKAIAYSKNADGSDNIWIKRLDDQAPRQVTFNGYLDQGPIWSPDGSELAFVSNREEWYGIWRVPSGGGTPRRVAPLTGPGVALCRWSKDGRLIYFQMAASLHQLELESGRITNLTDGGESGKAHDFAVSPDESKISYSLRVGNNQHIFVSPLKENRPRQVTSGSSNNTDSVWYSDSRNIAYISQNTGPPQILKVAIDGGKETRITYDDSNYEYVSASPAGDILAAVATDSTASILSCSLDGQERIEQTGDPRHSLLFPDVSSLAGKIVFQKMLSASHFEGELLITRLGGKDPPETLAQKGAAARWSPQGTAIAFLQLVDGKLHLVSRNTNEVSARVLASQVDVLGTTRVPVNQIGVNFSWSPDGRRIAYASVANPPEPSNIRVVSSDGAPPSMVTKNENPGLRLSSPIWSPDGNTIAFTRSPRESKATGKYEIMMIRDGVETAILEEQFRPRLLGWSSSGTEVLMAVGSSTEPSLLQTVRVHRASRKGRSAITPTAIDSAYLHSFKLSPDGRHVAFVHRVDSKDNISVVDVQTGKISKLSQSNETGLYISGLTWSSDSTRIFFSRQETLARVVSLERPADK